MCGEIKSYLTGKILLKYIIVKYPKLPKQSQSRNEGQFPISSVWEMGCFLKQPNMHKLQNFVYKYIIILHSKTIPNIKSDKKISLKNALHYNNTTSGKIHN
jgi:hypothetical protein